MEAEDGPEWIADPTLTDLPFGFENELSTRPIYSPEVPSSGAPRSSMPVAPSFAEAPGYISDEPGSRGFMPAAEPPSGAERSSGTGESFVPKGSAFDIGALERSTPADRPSLYEDEDEDLPKVVADWPTDGGTIAYQADLSSFKDVLGTRKKRVSDTSGPAPAEADHSFDLMSRAEANSEAPFAAPTESTVYEHHSELSAVSSGRWSLGKIDDDADSADLYGAGAPADSPFASLLTSRSELLEDTPPLASASRAAEPTGDIGPPPAPPTPPRVPPQSQARPASFGTLAELRSSLRAERTSAQASADSSSSGEEASFDGAAPAGARAPLPHERSFFVGRMLHRSAVGFICSVPLLFTGAIWVGSHNLEHAPRGVSRLLQLQTENLPKLAPTGLEVVDLSADGVSLDNGEKVLELRGALLNTTAREFSHIRLDARLFDRENNLLAREVVPASSGITSATLSSLTPGAIKNLQERPALEERVMKPNEKRPIRVVFTTPEPNAAWYSLKVYSVHPAAER